VLVRWGIRLAASLVGIAVGIILSAALLTDFNVTTTGVVVATVLFWIVHLVINFIALRILIRQPSVSMAGLLALASTIVALFIVNIVVDDVSIHGATTYLLATLIIWLCTALGDVIGTSLVRARRRDRRDERRA
jgi:hypothetical protein